MNSDFLAAVRTGVDDVFAGLHAAGDDHADDAAEGQQTRHHERACSDFVCDYGVDPVFAEGTDDPYLDLLVICLEFDSYYE